MTSKNGIRTSFLIYIIVCSLINLHKTYAAPKEATGGELDFSGTNLDKAGLVKLRGEWKLYWNQLLNPGNIDEIGEVTGNFYLPGKWSSVKINGEKLKGKGFLTVRLKLILQKGCTDCGIKLLGLNSAANIFVNGKLIYNTGEPGINKSNSAPGNKNGYIYNIDLKKENDIIIQVSNYELISGGIQDIYIGKSAGIYALKSNRSKTDFFLFGSILIMALYHLGIFLIRKENISALYFGLFCIILALRTLIVGDKNLLENFHLSWTIAHKIEYLTFYSAAPLFLYFTKRVFSKSFSQRVVDIFVLIAISACLLVIFTPTRIYAYSLIPFQFLTGITGIYITYISVKSIKKKKSESSIFLLGWIFLFITIINDILYDNEILHLFENLTSIGLFIFIVFQAFLLATEFSKAVFQAEKLAKKLNYTNKNLTNIVDFRTKELEKQKQDLFYQKRDIEHKNKDITDSLNYASKIQSAVLPEDKQFRDSFDDFFILYKPKDIVSGDFYWVKRIRSKIIVAAADCTGHGVPGAFMSLLGIAFLNEIVNMMAYRQETGENIVPNKILDELRNRIKDALRQTGNIDEAFDGIDMALCILDYVEGKLYYAGANNSLYIVCQNSRAIDIEPEYLENNKILKVENDEMTLYEIKANRMPIGAYLAEQPFSYHEFNLDDIGHIYMFSDGFADQLGGEHTTKFRQKRFRQLILDNAGKKMEEQYDILKYTIENWMDKDVGQIDDITVLGIKVHADREEKSFGLF